MSDQQQQTLIAGVRFSKIGKAYHFIASRVPELKLGDSVVVETSRGWQLGEVVQIFSRYVAPSDEPMKLIERRATPRDLLLRQVFQAKEQDVVKACQVRVSELNLTGLKIITSEYSFEGSRLSIFFSTETEEKVELKSLRQDMQRQFEPAQVEMRQIGPRDVAKILGGMGACGLETRCCSKFLVDFSSISIRMAKEQGISLTPTEITGMCGRLRCCLNYEYEHYVQSRALLPKRNKIVQTPAGVGKVIDAMPLQMMVQVDIPEVGYRIFHKDEITILDGAELPARKPQPEPPQPSSTPEAGTNQAYNNQRRRPRRDHDGNQRS